MFKTRKQILILVVGIILFVLLVNVLLGIFLMGR